jgi:pimeloyl-ACP methyl ester carboxylesterase
MIVQNGISFKEPGVSAFASSSSPAASSIAWVTRPGGRRVAYEQFGDPDGVPVLFCHGWMASRLARHPDDELTASLGIRLVTFDRAGIGRSDPDPAKSLLSAAGDLAAVADELALDRFALLGHSGGGPYALACAHASPDRVAAVAICSGFAPFDRPDAYAGMTSRMRGYVRLLRAAPWLSAPLLRGVPRGYGRDPDRAFAKQFGDLCPADEAALAEPATRESVLASTVEALAGGHTGVAQESRLLFTRPWGFDPRQVRNHVELHYGSADTLVPLEMGRYLEQVIPDSRLTIHPDEGHMLHITHWAEILAALAAANPAPG